MHHYLKYMLVTFEETYLQDLYEKGVSTSKKHRYQPSIIARYIDRVNLLKKVITKEELFPIKSLHFEALVGNKRGRFSIKVNNQYRVEFTINENLEQPVLTICNIVELSNHYD